MKGTTATISKDSPRYEEWLDVLGTDTVQVKGWLLPEWAIVLGEKKLVWQLDLDQLTEEQMGRLISHIARKFSIERREVVETIRQIGVPLLAEDLIVSSTDMSFL